MSRRGESELQIELTELQIEHEQEVSRYNIFISVMFSFAFTSIAVILPISIQINNMFLGMYSLIPFFVGGISGLIGFIKLESVKKELNIQIEKLKKKYLW